MTQDQILEFCVVSLANVLRVPKDVIQIDTKFSRLGLDFGDDGLFADGA